MKTISPGTVSAMPALLMASGGRVPLSQREKAAIVVQFLLTEGAELTLADLPEDLQSALAVQFGAMQPVDKATLAQVVAEFAQELEQIALLFPRGMTGALSALDGRISPQTASRLRKEAGVRQAGDPWISLRRMGVDVLLPFLTCEAPEVSAVILSKLDVAKAAELLGMLPGPAARHIAYAMSQTQAVTPEAVYRIGLSVAMQLDQTPDRAFEDGPEKRIGAILNLASAQTRDDVLTGLEEEDEVFAESVRRAIFTFVQIPARIDPRDVPKVLRSTSQPDLICALAYAQAQGGEMAEAADFILSNISSRLADGMREEIAAQAEVKAKAGDAAMTTVIGAIRALEESGELSLLRPDSEEAA